MNRLEEIDELLKNFNIDQDQYKMWSENIVTQRFMLEFEKDLLETREDYASGKTIEDIAIKSIKNGQHCETLEHVLAWIPDELVVNKD